MATAAGMLVGCAQQGVPGEPRQSFAHPLHCYSAKQCDAMWTASQEAIERESGMKIRLVTATRIETYNETSAGRMYGVVKLWRSPDESDSTITAEFTCALHAGCLPDTAVRQFNVTVRASGQGY